MYVYIYVYRLYVYGSVSNIDDENIMAVMKIIIINENDYVLKRTKDKLVCTFADSQSQFSNDL